MGGAQRTGVFSFYISIFARVRRSAGRAKTHRNMMELCQKVLKTNTFFKTISLSAECNLGGGLQCTLELLTAGVTLNQMF